MSPVLLTAVLATLCKTILYGEESYSDGKRDISNAIAAYHAAVKNLTTHVEIKTIAGIQTIRFTADFGKIEREQIF